ncbi:hypothetical protein F4809DRAFT_660770 [Biscogniauxia mediterranea]|nr:hypothetical protein F4809DRAFT_660770 [Biscogniauxia mediterranea]
MAALANIMSLVFLLAFASLGLATGDTATPYGGDGGATAESSLAAASVTETVTVTMTLSECAMASPTTTIVTQTTIQSTTTVYSTITSVMSKTVPGSSASSTVETITINASGTVPPQTGPASSSSTSDVVVPSVNPSGGYTYPASSSASPSSTSSTTSTSSSTYAPVYGTGALPTVTLTESLSISTGLTPPFPTGQGTITQSPAPTVPSSGSMGPSSTEGAHTTTASIVPANGAMEARADIRLLSGALVALVTLMVTKLI